MHPAFSIVVFTVLSGAGFGLVSLACLAQLLDVPPQLAPGERLVAGTLGLALVTVGLLASTLHLANKRNAWRALFRFRTSWLSREGVFALLFYPSAAAWLASAGWADAPAWLAGATAVSTLGLALAAVISTGMIYASLRTIPQWHTAWVPVNYLLLGFASGSLLETAVLAFLRDGVAPAAAGAALVWLAVALGAKLMYYRYIGRPRALPDGAALGMTQGRVRLLESGQAGPSFLDREFRAGVSAHATRRLRLAAAVLGLVLPAVLVAPLLAPPAPALLVVPALAAAFVGLGIGRWLFFAEARHVVNSYYGDG